LEASTSRTLPDWVSLNKDAFKGQILRVPSRDDIQPIANEQAVVEFYSR
jgi:small subunit ribosomal protein S4